MKQKVQKVGVPFVVKIQKLGQSGVGRVEVSLLKETKSPKSQSLVWSKLKSWESQSWTFCREKSSESQS
jgi:hypothetical protein